MGCSKRIVHINIGKFGQAPGKLHITRRTDTVDKWFSSRRMVAIRRNNANGTAIIGSDQTIGTDQTEGSPAWSVAITADDTNEALQVEVTGAASETVNWRVMAFYQVV